MVLKQQFRTAGSSFRAECQASFGIHRSGPASRTLLPLSSDFLNICISLLGKKGEARPSLSLGVSTQTCTPHSG